MIRFRILTNTTCFLLFFTAVSLCFHLFPVFAQNQNEDQVEPVAQVAQAASSQKTETAPPVTPAEPVALAPEIPAKSSVKVNPEDMDALLVYFRDLFYAPEHIKTKYELYDYRDFILQETSNDAWNSNMGVVTRYEANLVQSKLLKDVHTLEEAQAYIDSHLKVHPHRGLDIPEITFDLGDGKTTSRYWVGQKAFGKLEEAEQALDQFANEVEKKSIPFNLFVSDLKENGVPYEEPEEVILGEDEEQYGAATANLEETIANYLWEKADAQRFSGKAADEPWFLWQSVAETTWRSTNFSYGGFNDLVGYFANRIRVRGLKMPHGSSLDPFIDGVVAFSSDGRDFDNNLHTSFGLEYRLFRGFKSLDRFWYTAWIKNIRAHVDYHNRYATKDPITGSPDFDWRAGVDVFKEWGIDIPEEGKPDLWWGEYFGEYDFRKNNFSFAGQNNGYNSFLAVTRVLLGVKWPTFTIPDNPMNDHITLMPYMGWEWINNNHLNDLFFENRYFALAGVRWMPFRNKRHERREWIYKMKLFFEYAGLGSVQYTQSGPPENNPAFDVDNDFRFGINISSNRF